MNALKSCFAVTFLMVLLIGKLICCLCKFSVLFYNHKQFHSRFVASVEYVPGWKQLLKDVLLRNKVQSTWGSCKIVQRKWSIFWIILLKILPRFLYLWCSQNVVLFAIKTESWLCQSCLLVRFLTNTATFERSVGF